jgi:S1-C subfamily serine protease
MNYKCITVKLLVLLNFAALGITNARAEPVDDALKPLERPNIDSAKVAVSSLNDLAKTMNGSEREKTIRIAETIKELFTEDYRVGVAIDGIAIAEKAATKQDETAANWLIPNSFGSINQVAANTAIRKAKELREGSFIELKNARLKLETAMRKADVLLNVFYDQNHSERVIIFYGMLASINNRSMEDNPFRPTITEAAVDALKDFKIKVTTWLAEAKAAEDASNHEKALLLYTKARNMAGRERNAAKLGAELESKGLFGSAIEYYEISGDFARAKNLRASHPQLLASSFSSLEPEEIFTKSSSSCVKINTDKGMGSGFFFKRGGYIMTNHHVVKEASEIIVKTDDNKKFNAVLVADSETPDLAVIKIDLEQHDIIRLGNAELVKTGSSAVLIGYPKDTPTLTMNTGRISNTNIKYEGIPCYQLDVSANHGNSGGPVLDAQGRAIGVLTFGWGDFDYDRFNFAISVHVVRTFLEKKLGTDFSNN